MKRFSLITVFVLIAAVAFAKGAVTGEQVMAALQRIHDGINDYQVDVTVSVSGPKARIKNMPAHVYYKKPDKVRVKAKDGFAVLPQGTFFGDPMRELAKNSKAVYIKSEKKNGVDCHKLRLVPKDLDKAPEAVIWVDAKHSVVVATDVGGGGGFTTQWKHRLVNGKHYLPSEIKIDMRLADPEMGNGHTQAIIKFSNYIVNKGISDKVFEQAPRKK